MSNSGRITASGNSGRLISNDQLAEAKASDVNTDLATWDKQFKAAIKNGAKPEKDLFGELSNEFDDGEW
jgi:hypothetical protein